MNIVRAAAEIAASGRKACLAIGFFDGVHLGHQQIIRQAAADAQQHDAVSVVVSFDRHPASVIAPDRAPLLIQTLEHRLETIGRAGPDSCLLLTFDSALRNQRGADFIRNLHRDLGGIQSVCIGADFHFGYKRTGNVALLRELGGELGFKVHGISSVALGGQTISSTRIRESISRGHLEDASEMLGRAYSISGRVIRGDQLGRQLGFPTANLEVAGLVWPPNGVYIAQAITQDRRHHAVVNIGRRPTINSTSSKIRFEAHLLDFGGNLYDQTLEVILVSKLRDEQQFNSREELQAQIARDIACARTAFE